MNEKKIWLNGVLHSGHSTSQCDYLLFELSHQLASSHDDFIHIGQLR